MSYLTQKGPGWQFLCVFLHPVPIPHLSSGPWQDITWDAPASAQFLKQCREWGHKGWIKMKSSSQLSRNSFPWASQEQSHCLMPQCQIMGGIIVTLPKYLPSKVGRGSFQFSCGMTTCEQAWQYFWPEWPSGCDLQTLLMISVNKYKEINLLLLEHLLQRTWCGGGKCI